MSRPREILKVGLAVTEADRLLVVRKRGAPSYILPGGKPEQGENDIQALRREIEEELGCSFDSNTLVFLGSFSDLAADLPDTTVTVRLYAAELVGAPEPQSEIEALEWFSPELDRDLSLAPSLRNHIVPFLFSNGRLTGKKLA
jgi:8-oxo-dGTP diphosphatase